MNNSQREAKERSLIFNHLEAEEVRKMFITRSHEKEFAFIGEPITHALADDHVAVWNGYEATMQSPYLGTR